MAAFSCGFKPNSLTKIDLQDLSTLSNDRLSLATSSSEIDGFALVSFSSKLFKNIIVSDVRAFINSRDASIKESIFFFLSITVPSLWRHSDASCILTIVVSIFSNNLDSPSFSFI